VFDIAILQVKSLHGFIGLGLTYTQFTSPLDQTYIDLTPSFLLLFFFFFELENMLGREN
jgi:hypothetical protein